MLKSLEEKGWIRRVADENDKRIVNVFVTDEGKRKRDIARKGVIEFNTLVQERISIEKLDVFFEVMREISRVVENEVTANKVEQAVKVEVEI
jgi:DNA-binding MarR family transcriptional regulator